MKEGDLLSPFHVSNPFYSANIEHFGLKSKYFVVIFA